MLSVEAAHLPGNFCLCRSFRLFFGAWMFHRNIVPCAHEICQENRKSSRNASTWQLIAYTLKHSRSSIPTLEFPSYERAVLRLTTTAREMNCTLCPSRRSAMLFALEAKNRVATRDKLIWAQGKQRFFRSADRHGAGPTEVATSILHR